MWPLLWLGCPAEQLGIELPPPGAASISAEDLRRDVLGLSKPDWPTFFGKRLADMRLEPVSSGPARCGRVGRGEPVRVVVGPEPTSVETATALAVVISVAKAADSTEGLTGTRWYCAGKPDVEGQFVWIDRVAPGTRAESTSGDGVHVVTGEVVPGRRPEAVDYRAVAEIARAFWQDYSG